jgi:hypothetical protein
MAKAEKPAPRISVLDRRLQNPFGEPSAPVSLKDSTLIARWFNGAIVADKIWRAKSKGWTPVTPAMIVDLDQIGGYTLSPDGYVSRGDRCQEVLMTMPREVYDQIVWAKDRHNKRNMGNPDAQRRDVMAAVGEKYGDQAAAFIGQKVGAVGGVTDSYERIERKDDSD